MRSKKQTVRELSPFPPVRTPVPSIIYHSPFPGKAAPTNVVSLSPFPRPRKYFFEHEEPIIREQPTTSGYATPKGVDKEKGYIKCTSSPPGADVRVKKK